MAGIIHELRAGESSEALALTQAQLRAHPGDCRLWSLQGVALAALGRQPDSLHSFQHALVLCPSYLPALEGAAQLTFATQDPSAESLLHRILALEPADATSHAMLASLLARSGKCTDAIPHFAASQPLFATHPQLLLDYGSCLEQAARWPEAAQVFSELVRAHPGSRATYGLAVALWRSGQPREALLALEPILNQGTDERALVLGSSIAESLGDTAQAVTLLRSAILAKPDNVDNYLAFARLAEAHHSFQVGVDLVNVGIGRMPDVAALYVARGVLRVQMSQVDAGEADFQHAHELDPKLTLAMDAIGILQEQEHQNAASLALFREQAAAHPQDALLQYLLAEALSESTGDSLNEALTAAQRACALDPSYQPALDLLSNLYLRTGRPEQAVQQAELALSHQSGDTSALFVELRAKRKLGDTKGVKELAQRLKLAEQANATETQKARLSKLTDTSPDQP